ncbi:MAG: nucleoside diphosphate kinase regulator [Armatimonadetes bacterium]|nr:nucleoside diphosphate kinase regulator [Armatimonadota bacterium]
MGEREVWITEHDKERLEALLESGEYGVATDLTAELRRARIVAPEAVPPDVVTMNSTVRLVNLDTGQETECKLVFPEEADASQGKVSVLAPIGTAMLGYRVGDTFEWRVPAGVKRFRVAEVIYQPEASGEYHL